MAKLLFYGSKAIRQITEKSVEQKENNKELYFCRVYVMFNFTWEFESSQFKSPDINNSLKLG